MLFLSIFMLLLVVVSMSSLLLKNLKFLLQNTLCFKKEEKMQEEIDSEQREEREKDKPKYEEFSDTLGECSSEKSPDSQS